MRKIWLCAMFCLVLAAPFAVARAAEDEGPWQLDVQGRGIYSHYNFTDVKNPYDGVDAFMEIKPAWWFDDAKQFGLYASVLPVYTTEDEFWWQRNVQYGIGLQAYLVGKKDDRELLRPLRLFVLAAGREYYDEEEAADPEDSDVQAGADYYYDSLYKEKQVLAVAVFAQGSYRDTNFSEDDYSGFISFGNVQAGPKVEIGPSLIMAYGVADWSVSPSHDEKWWENYIRLGGGVRWHPLAGLPSSKVEGQKAELQKRFHLFAEYLSNVEWLGDEAPDSVEEDDYRIGIAFSTGGFYGQ